MKINSLIENLKLDLEWAEANEWESPICLADDLRKCLSIIEKMSDTERGYFISHDSFLRLWTDHLVLIALENGGVDNWNWYGESIRQFIEDNVPKDISEKERRDWYIGDIATEDLKDFRLIELEEDENV